MTNKERVISLLGFSPPVNSVEGAMLDEGLNLNDTYDPVSLDKIKRATIEVLKIILSSADITNQETGFSSKYDRVAVQQRIKALQAELGITDSGPTIKATSPW